MNLLYAAESIIKSRIDKYGFTMNTCIHDQSSENLDKFLKALADYQLAMSDYEVIQTLKAQIKNDAMDNVEDED